MSVSDRHSRVCISCLNTTLQLLACFTIYGNYLRYKLQLYIFISSFHTLVHETPVIELRLLTDIQTCRPVVCIRLLEKLQVRWPHNFEHVKQVLRKKAVVNSNFIKRREKCIYLCTVIEYKPTKCTFSKWIFQFLIFWCLLHLSNRIVCLQEDGFIQGGPKVGIQYIVYKLLYTYFWPTLYTGKLRYFTCINFGSLVGRRVCSIPLFISDALRHISEEPQTILYKVKPTRSLQGCCRVAGVHRSMRCV
jgi:hypothetical protein